ncbi:MAG TPA: LysM peptidoglycan-binding domain-containing protein [Egibacteraceae bacterium]|jgi:nucleoid-associated protein YgaU|nr:LysM peptidoglycan-binding domain-containing protein [Egibacteraceae bacterium]
MTFMQDSRTKPEKAYLSLKETAAGSATGAAGSGAGTRLIEFRFNPEQYSISKSATWKSDPQKRAEEAPPPQFEGTGARTLELAILLDESETGNNVQSDVEKLFDCCTPSAQSIDNNQPRPPYVVFAWGTFFSFTAYITSVTAKYTLFRPNGAPIRAECSLKLTEVPEARPRQNPTSGTLEAHRIYTVSTGDTLASVAYREYADAALWRALAEANDIDDPMRLLPGTSLLIPPAAEAGAHR